MFSISVKTLETGAEPDVVHLSNNKRTLLVASSIADPGTVSDPAEMKRFR